VIETSPADGDVVQAEQERLTFSVDEAARALGVSRNLMYDLVAQGRVPSVRLGRRIVVPRRALEELLSRQ
jgi:excisionase family DNA binding protein